MPIKQGAVQRMREITDTFGSPEHLQLCVLHPECVGAAPHDEKAAMLRHRALLEALRMQRESAPDP